MEYGVLRIVLRRKKKRIAKLDSVRTFPDLQGRLIGENANPIYSCDPGILLNTLGILYTLSLLSVHSLYTVVHFVQSTIVEPLQPSKVPRVKVSKSSSSSTRI